MIRTLTFIFLFSCITVFTNAAERGFVVQTQDGQNLTGLLTLPENAPPRSVVLILQGSGNVGMDGDVSGPFVGQGYQGQPALLSRQISEALDQVGVASLRFHKRGFEDPNQLKNQTIDYLISDAKSAFLQLRSQFPGIKTGLIGFSEGAIIASHIANEIKADFLFLMAPPTRTIDEILEYQFFAWPTRLLKNRLDQNQDGFIDEFEVQKMPNDFKLPLLSQPWNVMDQNADGVVSVQDELLPVYMHFYREILKLLETPDFKGWYESLKALPSYFSVAEKNTVPTMIYFGGKDPQVDPVWIRSDVEYFKKSLIRIREYPSFGHCFAPLEGWLGEQKTSGPLSDGLLNDLKNDILIF